MTTLISIESPQEQFRKTAFQDFETDPNFKKDRTAQDTKAYRWIIKSAILSAQNRLPEALAALEKSMQLLPNEWRLGLIHANFLTQQSQWDKAFISLDHAFALRKKEVKEKQEKLYYMCAQVLLALGVLSMDKGDLDRSQELMAHFRRLQIQGRIERKVNAVRRAIKDFKAANPQQRESIEALLAMLKNPWVNWEALSLIVTERWPEGLSAVEAVRQARE